MRTNIAKGILATVSLAISLGVVYLSFSNLFAKIVLTILGAIAIVMISLYVLDWIFEPATRSTETEDTNGG